MNIGIHRNKGISLIEVMIAFAVTSVLMAFSMPSYVDQAIQANFGTIPAASISSCEAHAAEAGTNEPDTGYAYIHAAEKTASPTGFCSE
jgi:Tfp pilus assembly protein PilE